MANAFARYGSLAVAAGAFLGASIDSDLGLSAVLATAGLILTGVWITLETHYLLGDNPRKEPDDDAD